MDQRLLKGFLFFPKYISKSRTNIQVYRIQNLELNNKWSTVKFESRITYYSNSCFLHTNKTDSIILEPPQMSKPYLACNYPHQDWY